MRLVIKLIIFVVIIEVYFIIYYILSNVFLKRVSNLLKEFRLLITRMPNRSFLFLAET